VDPSWLDFDEGGLWGHAARAYRDLGRPRRARRFAEDAIALCRPEHSRTRAQRTAILATVLVQLGEAEEAAQRVVAEAWRLHSSHVMDGVRQLLGLMGATNASSIFAEQARDLIAARPELGATGGLSG
jgi:hypothetical protein